MNADCIQSIDLGEDLAHLVSQVAYRNGPQPVLQAPVLPIGSRKEVSPVIQRRCAKGACQRIGQRDFDALDGLVRSTA